jgi:hypothetical protein
MRGSLCIRSADIVQPVLLVFPSSCINIKCSKLPYAVLNRNDIVVANMMVDKIIYKYKYRALLANVCTQKNARSSGYELADCFWLPAGAGILLVTPTSKNSLGPRQPPVQQAQAIFPPCVKLPDCKAEHLSSYFAKIKNTWSYIFTAHYVFMTWCVIS